MQAAAARTAGVRHVILFIGDGMNLEHEIAGSRYLYGEDYGLAWNAWGQLADGWAGFCCDLGRDHVQQYASALGQAGLPSRRL